MKNIDSRPLLIPDEAQHTVGRFFSRERLRQGLRGGGCPICHALELGDQERMRSFLREGMMAPDARLRFLLGEGFCPSHWDLAWHLVQQDRGTKDLGTAILAEQLLEQWAKRLARDHGSRSWWQRRQSQSGPIWPPRIHCMICDGRRSQEQLLTSVLPALAENDELRGPAEEQLCAQHAWMTLSFVPPDQAQEWNHRLQGRIATLRNLLRNWIHQNSWEATEASDSAAPMPAEAIEFLHGKVRP